MELEKTRTDVRVVGGKLPPIALPTNCPGCGVALDPEELRKHAYVCECGHHFRLGADAWIALMADRGSWKERWGDVRSHDLLNWKVPKPYQATIEQLAEEGLNEAVRTGTCTLGGRAIWLAVFDFRFVGGTLSIVAGERLARGMEQAVASGLPYLLVAASGGARMQEGVLALMQMAKVNAAVGRVHAAGEPGAAIGFTGPRVIKQATYADLPPGFQSADFQLARGQVDMVVPRTELRRLLAHLVEIYP